MLCCGGTAQLLLNASPVMRMTPKFLGFALWEVN